LPQREISKKERSRGEGVIGKGKDAPFGKIKKEMTVMKRLTLPASCQMMLDNRNIEEIRRGSLKRKGGHPSLHRGGSHKAPQRKRGVYYASKAGRRYRTDIKRCLTKDVSGKKFGKREKTTTGDPGVRLRGKVHSARLTVESSQEKASQAEGSMMERNQRKEKGPGKEP